MHTSSHAVKADFHQWVPDYLDFTPFCTQQNRHETGFKRPIQSGGNEGSTLAIPKKPKGDGEWNVRKNINEPLRKARKSTQRHTVGQRRSDLRGTCNTPSQNERPTRVEATRGSLQRTITWFPWQSRLNGTPSQSSSTPETNFKRSKGTWWGIWHMVHILPTLVQPRGSLPCAKSLDRGPFFPKTSAGGRTG